MRCRVLDILAVILLLLSPLHSGDTSGHQRMSVQPLLEVLQRGNVSGSLDLSGPCDLGNFPDFPSLRMPRSGTALGTVREMLAGDQDLQVTQGSDSIIRIKQLGVPSDFLDVRIKHIRFQVNAANGQHEIYDQNTALELILQAPEVVLFMKNHHVAWRYEGRAATGSIGGTWPSTLPHISGSLSDVTVSEALDWILRTFPGLWLYENCPAHQENQRTVYLRFYRLQRFGLSTVVVGQ